ncbi:chloramphenicol 3-O-phosphotransferase [Okibacterium sp. HSC-33S16]|uniref:AAA family ATPase n=1 Tax=Okibacterium sp. HSC-33S16 TaxID=2910965 RepID=UPI0020A19419|nr:AAA family ATPase [Okibacterium sp. HSC-33S16]MCP2032112.1 chloramphenicol 3-O-phosphotransferase [Okibacterium sp. HSC-33S16]
MELIFLHGPAAAGKLTTARALEQLVGYPAFHNHLVVDTLTTVFAFGSEPFVRLRERFWLDVIGDAATIGRSLSFTFTPEPTVPLGFSRRVRELVERSGGYVRFVRLTVSDTEQERRIENEDRHSFHKLNDVSTLRRVRNETHGPVEHPPVDLEIDTEASSAEESAALIAERFGLRAQAQQDRYPER